MNDYVILTDSCCDITESMKNELGIGVLPLTFSVMGKEYLNYLNEKDMPTKMFYTFLRNGEVAKTSAANIDTLMNFFEKYLNAGNDIIYLSFSSGLSSTYSTALLASDELKQKYKASKIICVDTLCASMGQGLLVYHAAMAQKSGKTIEEVRDYIESIKLNLCHWFTVDDLNHLKRGGRLSSSAALIGTVLNIKPVLHVDNDGHLINVSKVRGRKTSIKALVDNMRETGTEIKNQTVFISHGDCEDEAIALKNMVDEEFHPKKIYINFIGPVIGAHSGPGTLALFFLGEKR